MGGETGVPLPVIPKALADERLSSRLARMAEVYLVSPGELVAHMGLRTKRIHDLDLDPHADDIDRLVVATGVSAPRLSRMTFRDAPASLRGFINIESEEVCPSCVGRGETGRIAAAPGMDLSLCALVRQARAPFEKRRHRRRRGSRRRGVRAPRREILARPGDGRRRDDADRGGRVELAAHPMSIAFARGALGARRRVAPHARRAAKGAGPKPIRAWR